MVVETCLIVDLVRKNWSWIFAAGCGLHYFVLACFGAFWVVANFSTAERFKYMFFTVMKISTIVGIVKKQNNFHNINLSDVFHLYYSVRKNCTGTIIEFVLKSSLYNAYMRLCDCKFYSLIPPARLFHSAQSFSFELRWLAWLI